MIKSLCRHSAVWFFSCRMVSYFFQKKYVSSTLTGFCVLKRVGYAHPFFPLHRFARVCPVKARMSLSWHSQRHCWLRIYIHRCLLGFPPTVLLMELQKRSMTYVGKCKRRLQKRSLTYVGQCKRRLRKRSMTYVGQCKRRLQQRSMTYVGEVQER